METLNILELVNRQDNDGNTVLHGIDVVQSDGNNSTTLQIVPALLDVGAKRCDQLSPKDIQEVVHHHLITHSPGIRKLDSPIKHHYRKKTYHRSKQIELQNESLRNARNTITIVAVLIATVTFSAGINPPGGFSQENGKAIMGGKPPFKVFVLCNIMALFLSLGIVNVLVTVIPFRRKSMMNLLVATHKIMWVSTMFMAAAFIAVTWTILPQGPGSRWLVIELMMVGVGCTLVVLLGLDFLLAKQWSRKQEWRRRKEKKLKDGTPNTSLNSRVGEMHFVKNSR
ncbi:hypothetical protein L1987_86861 [Smallanthus sonchifolius]|uniref:Uncharacterized protein n=1 Tax=Smallanthus sonchifolius TaxID=185202 RepID=A0ACB8Y1C0_9ASTR|nr:hypothetical protein L1987_86861 [Smallanthus sonchifolius]